MFAKTKHFQEQQINPESPELNMNFVWDTFQNTWWKESIIRYPFLKTIN